MKIGLDYAATVGYGGNSVYSQNLIGAILRMDPLNDYYLYAFAHDVIRGKTDSFKNNKRVHLRPVYFSRLGLPIPEIFITWLNHVSFHLWAAIDGLDIFHFTNPIYYEKGKYKKAVISIHDLSSLHSGEWSKRQSAEFFRRMVDEMIYKSDKIIAVSEYTRKDITRVFKVKPQKVRVIYEAAGASYYPDVEASLAREKFNLNDYLLYVGQIQPRKNIVNLVLAYSRLPPELKRKYPLVMVGSARDKDYSEIVSRAIAENDLTPYVRILGRLSDNDVRELYSGARVLVFPSLFEGFGLPVLEALQCGTPVITSNTTSLPEVAGDAGILVDPLDISGLTEAMRKMLVDDKLYDTLKSRCLGQAKKFNWEKAARETVNLYESLYL